MLRIAGLGKTKVVVKSKRTPHNYVCETLKEYFPRKGLLFQVLLVISKLKFCLFIILN